MAQYASKLSDGHQQVLKQYGDTYKMPVYRTRRSASVPKFSSDATLENAPNIRLVNNGNGVNIIPGGIPFPVPKSGQEVIWNHLCRFRVRPACARSGRWPRRGPATTGWCSSRRGGLELPFLGVTVSTETEVSAYFEQKITSPAGLGPARFYGSETIDQTRQPRKAWVYNTGQRRVRRAPTSPMTTPDGGGWVADRRSTGHVQRAIDR
ncbi:MAG: hypothetical protein CM1200mP34_0190 [Verrucomicrobiales bacterium]|nr:MAG: hypothetical protein CM1200mP34_0190 [Verrucomicrobiales bacterium]